jgi:hypothetical protein
VRALLWALLLAGCAPLEAPPLATTGPVTGAVHVPAGLGGDAWVFLYRPGEGPPGNPAVPVAASAVSAQRLADGDPHFVVSNVKPDPYRLWGLLDVDRNLDLNVDVLSQPTAGDRVSSRAVDVNVQPSRGASADLELDQAVTTEPPAFVLDTPNDDVLLDVNASGTSTLTLVADPVGTFDRARTAFSLGLVDADGDGRPDDANGDGTPDLSLTAVLRWRPLPGQLDHGSVVVPMLFNPAPFLGVLQGRLGVRVTADRLQLVMLPTATQLLDDGTTQSFGAPPPGDYELLLLSTGGQFWRLPNQLAGRLPSQGVRLHVDRKSP